MILCTAQCAEGSVELNRGYNNNSFGLVEMCKTGKWMSVCDTEWTEEDAATICQQVGQARKGTLTYVFLEL